MSILGLTRLRWGYLAKPYESALNAVFLRRRSKALKLARVNFLHCIFLSKNVPVDTGKRPEDFTTSPIKFPEGPFFGGTIPLAKSSNFRRISQTDTPNIGNDMKSKTMFAIFTGFVAMAGCFRWPDAPQPQAAVPYDAGPELALSQNDGEVQIMPEGATSTGKVALPDDIPIFDQASFTLAERTAAGELASYHVSPSVDEVRQFYAEEFTAHGWQIEDENSSGASWAYAATKAGRKLTVLLDGDETGTSITISHRGD